MSAVLVVTGCVTLETPELRTGEAPLIRRAAAVETPFFPQTRQYCGPAALASTLNWSGLSTTPDSLAEQVFTPGREGTLQADMVAAARRHGRLAVPVANLHEVLAEVAAGHPVLVFQNLALRWIPMWHYAVVVGYDLNAGTMVLHTGEYERRAVAMRTFERTWVRAGRWALVVLPPDTMPAAAGQTAVLGAAAGLERAGRITEAETAYTTMLLRWPDSYGAMVGLGNTRYARGDRAGAAASFRAATTRRPEAAAAWNNLAHVLGELGERDDALTAAREAVRLDGGRTPAYAATLQAIEEGR